MNMRIIDTHAHIQFHAFDDNWQDVVARAQEADVAMIIPGTNLTTSHAAVERAHAIGQNAWAAVGLHPIHLAKDIEESDVFDGKEYCFRTKQETFDKRAFVKLAQDPLVVAIGEAGLDYFHLDDFCGVISADAYIQLQKETLYEIMSFAREVQKPHIFHCRDAYDDFCNLIDDFGNVRGVVHCYTGTITQAQRILEQDLYIGCTGIVTFPNAHERRAVIDAVPLDRLLIETDSPYLAPQSVRGKRNEPAYVQYVAEIIAEVKHCSLEEVIAQTTQNAVKLFDLQGMLK